MATTKVTFGIAFSNNGDGSVSPRLFKTEEEAIEWEDKDREEGNDGWGETCARELTLTFKDGELVGYDEEGRKE